MSATRMCWAVALGLLAGCLPAGRPVSMAVAQADEYHSLVGVVSGDTIVVNMPEWDGSGMSQVNVHLVGISAPEVDPERQKFLATTARDAVARLLAEGWVRLEFNNAQNRPLLHYDGRLVADQECFVFVPGTSNDPGSNEFLLNEWMLDEGLAKRHHGLAENDRGILGDYRRRLNRAELRARDARRGLWSLPAE